MASVLHPAVVAELVLQAPAGRSPGVGTSAMSTGAAGPKLLDAVARLLRLLTGPQGGTTRQIGLADSDLSLVSRAIAWIRDNYAEPTRIDDLARLSGMSPSAFHRHFRR